MIILPRVTWRRLMMSVGEECEEQVGGRYGCFRVVGDMLVRSKSSMSSMAGVRFRFSSDQICC